ncbi:hypothetical protein ACVXG7_10050 [Enterobacter hormaechei]
MDAFPSDLAWCDSRLSLKLEARLKLDQFVCGFQRSQLINGSSHHFRA